MKHTCLQNGVISTALFTILEKLKLDFQSTPIMALTAKATPTVEDIKLLLRNPVVKKTSINRPNIILNVEELTPNRSLNKALQLAKRAAEIIGSTSSIVYTDFIADIGPIVNAFEELEIEAVGYQKEINVPSTQESFLIWKSGRVQTIVATKAFGLGIDKPNIFGMSLGMESQKASFLGLKSLVKLAKMDIRHVQQFYTNDQIFSILMAGF